MDDPQSPLILASQSPRRKSLMHEYGYSFLVHPPSDTAEGGMCSGETPPELVVRLAKQKAEDVAKQYEHAVIIGCDTVAECMGTVLGKPVDIDDARRMLTMLRGKDHRVLSGLCIWKRPSDEVTLKLDITTLHMDEVTDRQIEAYLATDKWQGKAGAFGYQDGWDWLHVIQGSETNVIGLPMEVLADALSRI
ncbi:MAG TPA: septum formation protein Maf [Planctomycetaceae bacterium]|jgi:septum formation protein|nr:Maf family protein [Pirellulales bacterium]HCK71404.1 septum formation protein Maf [Planctomycetaceae bacterium]|tara:strand:- start:1125 stop:1700 length:576 start_codon:yes stop_codon:yes gene_type:complete